MARKVSKTKKMTVTKKITFDELHRMTSKIDYINERSYPIVFTVDGVKYRTGIGSFNTDDIDIYYENYGDTLTEDYFYGYADEMQYLSRIDNYDEDASFEYEDTCGYEYIMDVQDPDDMEFNAIGEMLKRCCSITESSDIQLCVNHSFNGKQYDVFWMDMDQDILDKERENIARWKAELEADNAH
jgi:hypothetical protein